MSDFSNILWNKTLESRGVEAVRMLIAQSPGSGAGAVVRGLGDTPADMPCRDYAERWVARKDKERQDQQHRRHAAWHRWTQAGVIVAVVSAIVAAFEGWR
jgi:hypothetical protein